MEQVTCSEDDQVCVDAFMKSNQTTQLVASSETEKASTGILDIPTELLLMILCAVEVSPKMWLDLALTHSRFRHVVDTRALCISLTGHHSRPSMALAHSWSSNYLPQTAFTNIAEHRQLLEVEVLIFSQDIRRALEDAVTANWSCDERNVPVPDTFTRTLAAGIALLRHITFLTHKLDAPSRKSFDFTTDLIRDLLCDQAILLLRWTIYVIWFKAVRSVLYDSQPLKDDITKGYGPDAMHAASPIPPPNVVPTSSNHVTSWFTTVCYRRLVSIETSLLFGPSLGMVAPFGENVPLTGRFSGPFWAFYNHTLCGVMNAWQTERTCADGTIIDFYDLSCVMEERVRGIEKGSSLMRPPLTTKAGPILWHLRKGRVIEAMHLQIYKGVKEIDFLALGERLKKAVLEYM